MPWIWRQTAEPAYSFVLSLAAGPLLGSSWLFILLILFPGSQPAFYLSAWLALNILLIARNFQSGISVLNRYKRVFILLIGRMGKYLSLLTLLALFLIPPVYASLRQISEHDTFEYMALGENIYEQCRIDFPGFRYLPNGLFYVALHGFIYPLLYTTQLFFDTDQALAFKSLSMFYALLLMSLFAWKVLRYRKAWLLPAMLLLLSSYGFLFSILQFHLESIRIFLLFASVLLAFDMIRKDWRAVPLLGLLLGLQTGLHFIGFIASLVIMAGLLFFSPLSVQERIWTSVRLFAFVLVLGAIHYILEWFTDPSWWQYMMKL
jgi:hypothetical protein